MRPVIGSKYVPQRPSYCFDPRTGVYFERNAVIEGDAARLQEALLHRHDPQLLEEWKRYILLALVTINAVLWGTM